MAVLLLLFIRLKVLLVNEAVPANESHKILFSMLNEEDTLYNPLPLPLAVLLAKVTLVKSEEEVLL